jgi:hypothetical protein
MGSRPKTETERRRRILVTGKWISDRLVFYIARRNVSARQKKIICNGIIPLTTENRSRLMNGRRKMTWELKFAVVRELCPNSPTDRAIFGNGRLSRVNPRLINARDRRLRSVAFFGRAAPSPRSGVGAVLASLRTTFCQFPAEVIQVAQNIATGAFFCLLVANRCAELVQSPGIIIQRPV